MPFYTRYRVLQGVGTLYIGIHKGKCINWQSCALPQVQQNTEIRTSATNPRGWLLALKNSDTFWWVSLPCSTNANLVDVKPFFWMWPSDLLAFTNRGWLPAIKAIVAIFSFTLHTAPRSAAFAGTSGAVLDVLVLFSFWFYCLFACFWNSSVFKNFTSILQWKINQTWSVCR